MRRYLTILALAGLALTLASPCEAGAGHSTLKPKKPPSGGGSQAGGGQPANLDTHAHQAAANAANRVLAFAARELAGNYQTSNDRNDKLPVFDGDWTRDNIGQKLITLETSSPVAALINQIEADLLARGISVRPTIFQLQALQSPASFPAALASYLDDIALNSGYRNTQIEHRAGNYGSIRDLMGPDEYGSLLEHNGPSGTDPAHHYIPATAPFEH